MKAKAKRLKRQYTIRGVPAELDRALRQLARKQGKSLNEVALSALAQGAGQGNEPQVYHDLDFLIGSWVEDPAFDQVIADHERIDPELWR